MFTGNRQFIGLFYQNLMTKPTLTLIFCASLCLSLASGYTTWDGMTEFTNSGILSFLMTAGLQGLMLVLAWVVGKEYVADSLFRQSLEPSSHDTTTGKKPPRQKFDFFLWRHKGIILSFLLCAAVSVFFSFDSFFRNIYTETQRSLAATTTARTELQIITGEVETTLKQASLKAQKGLIKSAQWANLKKRMNGLAENTEKLQGLAALSQAENVADLAGSSAAIKSSLRLKAIELKQFLAEEKELSTTQVELLEHIRLAKLIAGLNRQKNGQLQKIENLKTQIADEIKTGQGERKSGCGRVCRLLQSQIAPMRGKLEDIQSQLQVVENHKIDLTDASSITNTALAAIRANIGATEAALGTLKANLEQVGQRQTGKSKNVNFADQLKGLTHAIAQFELDSNQNALNTIHNSCLDIITTIKSLNIPGQSGAFTDCSISEVATQILAANFDQRIAKTHAACRTDLSALSFDGVLSYGRTCLQVANLGKSLTTEYQRQLDRIALEYSSTAHPFERNLNAITSTNKLALLAAVLALLIDLLIFLTGIFGARQTVGILATAAHPKPLDAENAVRWALGASTTLVGDEDEETLKAKIFLSYLEPMEEIKDGFMCKINLHRVTPPYLEIINSVLNSGPYFERTDVPRVFLVADTMYRHLTKVVFQFEEHRKYARGNSVSSSTPRFTALAQNPHLVAMQNQGSELNLARVLKNTQTETP